MNFSKMEGVVLCLVLSLGSAVFAQSSPTYVFDDSGFERTFEMALNEVAVVDRDGRRSIQSVTGVADAESLVRAARSLRTQTGQRTELILYEAGAERNEYTRRYVTAKVLAELDASVDAAALAAALGVETDGRLDVNPKFAVFRAVDSADALALAEKLRAARGVISAQPVLAKLRSKKWAPNDTLYPQQWHLNNTGQGGGTPGIDVRVTNVWDTYRGSNIYIAIVDDGLQITHTDLYENVNTVIDYDWNDSTPYDPSPDLSADFHGSSCAGVAAARGNNGRGVSGAAPYATLVGLRLIGGSVGDTEEAAAMAHSNSIIHIKSNSWGPNDDGKTLEGPGPLTRAALSNGCWQGRAGKGVIYTWAAGNGLDANDNANYDGYANSMYTIAIAALADNGTQAWYSEPGACIVVTAPSSGGSTDIITTDLMGEDGYNYTGATGELADKNYTKTFGGTSSATPLAAGVIALLLEANPNLGWRDVQEILIRSATQNAVSDTDWKTNSAGFRFNHKYGAGLINARAAMALATNNWTNLGPRVHFESTQTNLNLVIPDNTTSGVVRTFNVTTNMRVEHVLVTLDVRHLSRGHLEVELTSPSGMRSRLAEKHSDTGDHYPNWTFMSVRHWGESAQGTWTVRVADRTAGTMGTQRAVRIDLYGTAAAAISNQPPSLTPIGSKSGTVSNLLQFAVTASDPVDGDAIRLWATNVPAWATFPTVTNAAVVTNTFSGTPDTAGTYTVYFFAGDKDGTNSEAVTINVAGAGGAGTNYIVDFEGSGETKNTYASGNVTLSGLSWNLAEALIGTDANDRKNGARAARMRDIDSVMTMLADLSGTLTNISFQYAKYGSDTNSQLAVDYSTDSGSTWINAGTVTVSSTTLSAFSTNVNASGNIRIRIRKPGGFGDNNRANVDDIRVSLSGGGGGGETPPVLNPIGDTSVQVSNLLQFSVTAQPTDGDPVTLSVSNAPAGATFVSTNENGTFSFTPNASQVGVHTTTFYAVDNDGAVSETIRITVTPASTPGASNVLVYYDFDLGAGFESSPESVAAYLSAGNMTTRDGTFTNFSGNPGRAISDAGFTGSVHYFEFTVTVAANHAMNVSGLKFDDRQSGTGPTVWRIRSSADSYSVDLASGGTHTSFATNEAAFNLPGLTGSVTFRIHGDSATSASGTWRLDNVTLFGEVIMSGGDDSDGDGLPDSWETAQFGSLSYGPGDDPDGDGQNNLEEMVAGTQPTNAASYFAIESIQYDTASRLSFTGLTGRTYRVQFKTNLVSDVTWTDLTAALPGSNGVMTVSDTNDAPTRLYRVRATLP